MDQAPRHGSVATVIAGEVAEHGWSYLRAPIMQVTALDAPIAYARPMEEYVLPNEERIVEAARKVVGAPAGRA